MNKKRKPIINYIKGSGNGYISNYNLETLLKSRFICSGQLAQTGV